MNFHPEVAEDSRERSFLKYKFVENFRLDTKPTNTTNTLMHMEVRLMNTFFLGAVLLATASHCSLAWASKTEPTALLPKDSTQSSATLVDLPSQLTRKLRAASQATYELQNGFNKLQRLCTFGPAAQPSAPSQSSDWLARQTEKAQAELLNVESNLQGIATHFSQNSRISSHSHCRYFTPLKVLGFACEGYLDDRSKLDFASRDMQKLTSDARQRLHLYEQFAKLEDQGCVRQGFTVKLWETETNFLWPGLVNAPAVFKSLLHHVPAQ